jgi:hypothetical protein
VVYHFLTSAWLQGAGWRVTLARQRSIKAIFVAVTCGPYDDR